MATRIRRDSVAHIDGQNRTPDARRDSRRGGINQQNNMSETTLSKTIPLDEFDDMTRVKKIIVDTWRWGHVTVFVVKDKDGALWASEGVRIASGDGETEWPDPIELAACEERDVTSKVWAYVGGSEIS
jgi:hypothetical protein